MAQTTVSSLVFMITNLGKPDFTLRLTGQNWKGSKRQLRLPGLLNHLLPVLLKLYQGNFVLLSKKGCKAWLCHPCSEELLGAAPGSAGWVKGMPILHYFTCRHRKRKNFISKLVSDDGLVLTKHEEKEKIVNEFYSTLLGVNMDRDTTINLEEVNIPSHDLTELDAPFSEEEVWKTISSLPSDKAPDPDGFTGKFYKTCWQIIKVDIMAAVSAVWSRKIRNFEQLNSAYITLLPKKEEATSIRDFRPVSLVHSFAKLITKLLANRLVGRLDQMVSPNQSAFIKGRFILKLNITKTFDSVS